MTIKVTMFFSAFAYSWSETHYLLGVTDFVTAAGPAAQLATYRQNCLGAYAFLNNVRLSNVPANRQVYDLPRTAWPASSYANGGSFETDDQTDLPDTSILLNLAQLLGNKNLYLAGVPDDCVIFTPTSTNGLQITGFLATYLPIYMNYLTTGGGSFTWGFRSRSPQPFTNVVGVGSQAGYNNNAGVVTTTDPGIHPGSEAYLKGFRTINPRVPNLSGAYQVIAVIPPGSGSPNWTTVLGETGNVHGDNFEVFGYIQPLVFTYLAYHTWRPVRATRRKRGGSYGRPVGRSRVRR